MTRRAWVIGSALTAVCAALVVWWACTRGNSGGGERPPPAPEAPRRIASLTLGTDEVLADLVPTERVVAVSHLADDADISNVAGRYPASIPRLRGTDTERLIALAPDLVCVAPYNTADSLKLLERAKLPVYRNEALNSLDEIEAGIVKLGERVGAAENARRVVERMQDRRRALTERVGKVARRPRVLFWAGGYTAGRHTTMDDVIREAGGRNIAVELGLEKTVAIAAERVVAADPDFVVVGRWKANAWLSQVETHPILRQLPAVRDGRVVAIEGRYLTTVSQFAAEGAERLARRLHPDLFPREAAP
jgi:iron complex transport system substrate-binding protein